MKCQRSHNGHFRFPNYTPLAFSPDRSARKAILRKSSSVELQIILIVIFPVIAHSEREDKEITTAQSYAFLSLYLSISFARIVSFFAMGDVYSSSVEWFRKNDVAWQHQFQPLPRMFLPPGSSRMSSRLAQIPSIAQPQCSASCKSLSSCVAVAQWIRELLVVRLGLRDVEG
jgi:hypothetical protein